MRTLTETLRSAQQGDSVIPAVKVTVRKRIAGALRLDWERLYSGTEPGGPHAAVIPADGSLVRCRVSPPGSGQALLIQRVTGPGPASDFSQWTDTGRYGVLAVAGCSLAAVISIFWIDSFRKLQRLSSTDCGATWSGPELLDYTPSTNVSGITAAYRPDGGMAVFFTDQDTLYTKQYSGSGWQNTAAWDKTTGDLSGVACLYANDWDLLLTGRDTSGNYKLWGLVYGAGGEVPPATWSGLKELAAAPDGEEYEYRSPFLDRTDVIRCFYVENFTGIVSYSLPFHSFAIPGYSFGDGLWREPVPFAYGGSHGLAPVHHGEYAWLTGPDGVWRASLADEALDLSADVLNLAEDISETADKITLELRNEDGRYNGTARPPSLDTGCRIEFSPGYRTGAGIEISDGPAFRIDAYEYLSAPGKATLLVSGSGGREALRCWTARHQFRWNGAGPEASLRQILEFVVARAGLGLRVISASSVADGFFPDFTIHPGESGDAVVTKLLSFVSDLLFFEGDCGYLLDPLPDDTPVYEYGPGHVIREGRYRNKTAAINSIEIEGLDNGTGLPLLTRVFDWEQVNKYCGEARRLADSNLGTIDQATNRGNACLRKERIREFRGLIRTAVNCGQRLYDVVAITDPATGLEAAPRRVLGISITYNPARGEYEQRLVLGNR